MSSIYLGILATAGLLAGFVALLGVYRDAGRRGLSPAGRLSLAVGAAAGCVGAFLLPAYGDGLRYVYFEVVKRETVTVSPYEWLAVSVVTGFLGCVLVAGAYRIGMARARPA